jgi:hypothetical protein
MIPTFEENKALPFSSPEKRKKEFIVSAMDQNRNRNPILSLSHLANDLFWSLTRSGAPSPAF